MKKTFKLLSLLIFALFLPFLALLTGCAATKDPNAAPVVKAPSRWSSTAFSVTIGYGALSATIGIPTRTSAPELPQESAPPGDGKSPALFLPE